MEIRGYEQSSRCIRRVYRALFDKHSLRQRCHHISRRGRWMIWGDFLFEAIARSVFNNFVRSFFGIAIKRIDGITIGCPTDEGANADLVLGLDGRGVQWAIHGSDRLQWVEHGRGFRRARVQWRHRVHSSSNHWFDRLSRTLQVPGSKRTPLMAMPNGIFGAPREPRSCSLCSGSDVWFGFGLASSSNR